MIKLTFSAASRLLAASRRRAGALAWALLLLPLLSGAQTVPGGTATVEPSATATCVASALNRNTNVANGYFMLNGVPDGMGPFRVRAVCTDGTVGQTAPIYPERMSGTVYDVGAISWGAVEPVPIAIELIGAGEISFGDVVNYRLVAKYRDGLTKDVGQAGAGSGFRLTPSNWWNAATFASANSPSYSSYGDRVSDGGVVTAGPGSAGGARGGYQLLLTAVYEGVAVAKVIRVGAWSSILGRITHADGTTPVAGARVEIQRIAPSVRVPDVVITGTDGRFTAVSTPVGDYRISVIDPVSGGRALVTTTLAIGNLADLAIALNGSGAVNVSVSGQNSGPVAGAQVVLSHGQISGQVQALVTTAGGAAAFAKFMSGPINVTVRDPATGAVGSARIALANGATANVSVVLQSVGAIEGRVLAADGSTPQPGMQVRLLSAARGAISQAITGSGGEFRFDTLPLADSPYVLQAYGEGQLTASKGGLVLTTNGQVLQQDLLVGTLAAAASVSGRALDHNGAPYANAAVVLTPALGQPLNAQTDAAGSFFFGGVAQGAFSVAAAAGSGYMGEATGSVASDSAEVTVTLRLTAVGEVRGQVLSSAGQPVGGVVVDAASASLVRRQATTDAAGQFVISQMPVGPFTLSVLDAASGERGHAMDTLNAPNESRQISVTLFPVGTVKVKLVNNGQPVVGARVSLTTQGGRPYGQLLLSDSNGQADFSGVPYSAYSISIVGRPVGAPSEVAMTVRSTLAQSEAQHTATVEASQGYGNVQPFSVSGRVLNNGQPVANALVRLSSRDVSDTVGSVYNPAWYEFGMVTDSNGRFAFNNVWLYDDRGGRLKLDAVIDGQLRARAYVWTPVGSPSLEQDLSLFSAGLVWGAVRSPDAIPLAGAQVQLRHWDRSAYTVDDFVATSSADGGFAMLVPSGQVDAKALGGGVESPVRSLGVQEGQALRADFTLGVAQLSGRVTSRSGQPVPGAVVRISYIDPLVNQAYQQVTPDASGRYSALLALGTVYVKVVTGQKSSPVATVAIDGDTIHDVELSGLSPQIRIQAYGLAPDSPFNLYINGVMAGVVRHGDVLSPNLATGATYRLELVPQGIYYKEPVELQLTIRPEDEGQVLPVHFQGAVVRLKPIIADVGSRVNIQVAVNGTPMVGVRNGMAFEIFLRTDQPRSIEVKDHHNRSFVAMVQVRPEDAGAELPVVIVPPVPSTFGEFLFGTQRDLHSVPVQAGDVLSVRIQSAEAASGKLAGQVRARVVNEAGQQLAMGYGYNAYWSSAQANEVGDLMAVPATAAGRLNVQLELYHQEDYYAGGYLMQVFVNGREVAAQPYVGGGQVRGTAAYASGQPAAGQLLQLSGNHGAWPNLVTRVTAQADGSYVVDKVPPGPLEVKALNAEGTRVGLATATLALPSSTVTANVTISRETAVDVTVRVSNHFSEVYYAYLQVTDEVGQRTVGPLYFNGGSRTSDPLRVTVIGNSAVLRATHPNNAFYYGEATVRADDGAQQQAQVVLSTGQLSGKVVNGAQQPLPGVLVIAYSQGNYFDATYTDSQGVYQFAVVPGGVPLQLSAEVSGVSASVTAVALENQQATAPDLVLVTGALAGAVKFADLSPAVGAAVEVLLPQDMVLGTYTDEQGRYVFPALPVGHPVTVRATNPQNGVVVSAQVTPQSGVQTAAPDLVFAATGILTGRVRFTNGQPVGNALVRASTGLEPAGCAFEEGPGVDGGPLLLDKMSSMTASTQEFTFETSTDQAGNYTFEGVPMGGTFTVSAAVGSLNCFQVSQQVNPGSGGVTGPLPDMLIEAPATAMTLRLVDGLGTPIASPLPQAGGECSTWLLLNGPGVDRRRLPVPPLGGTVYDGVMAGAYTAEIGNYCMGEQALGTGSATVGASGATTLSVVLPLLRGKVVFADGTDPDGATVSITQYDAEGNRKTIYGVVNYGDGGQGILGLQAARPMSAPLAPTVGEAPTGPNSFILLGMRLGDYELQASDNEFGLALRQTGTFTTPPGGVLTLVLPPSAVVKGCVKNASGAPAQPYTVNLWSTVPGWTPISGHRYTSPDASGCYEIKRVPNGNAWLSAHEGTETGVASVLVDVVQDSTEVVKDIQYQPKGTLRVRVTNAAGTPLPNQQALLLSKQLEPPLRDELRDIYTDASGYVTAVLNPGLYEVVAFTYPQMNDVGGVDVLVTSSQTTTATVVKAAGGRYLMWRDSADLFRVALRTDDDLGYMLSYDRGGLFSTGPYGYFDFNGGPGLYVNGLAAHWAGTADFPAGSREVKLGPWRVGDTLDVTRRLFVPPVGGYARVVDTVRNNSAAAQTAVVESRAVESSYCGPRNISLPQNNAARGYVTWEDCGSAFGHVYSGPGGAVQPQVVSITSSQGKIAQWTLTVPPGQSASVMQFFLLKPTGQRAAADTAAAELADQTAPFMLQDLTSDDKQSIRNFNLGP